MFFCTRKTPRANHAEEIWQRYPGLVAVDGEPSAMSWGFPPHGRQQGGRQAAQALAGQQRPRRQAADLPDLERQLPRATLPDPDDAMLRARRQGPAQHPHVALATPRENLRHHRDLATARRVG